MTIKGSLGTVEVKESDFLMVMIFAKRKLEENIRAFKEAGAYSEYLELCESDLKTCKKVIDIL